MAPVVTVAGVHPNVALVAVVLVAALRGFGPGVMWAFAAGVTANLLVREPLGSIPLGLLLVAAAVSGGERVFGRLAWIYPMAAVFVASIFVDALSLGILRLIDDPLVGGFPIQRILSAAFLNTMILAIFVLPSRLLVARDAVEEGGAW